MYNGLGGDIYKRDTMITLKSLIPEFYVPGFIGSDEKSKFRQPENFDKFALEQGKWTAHRGGNDWESGNTWTSAYFPKKLGESLRVWFEIKYPPHLEKVVGEGISSDRPEFPQIQEWGRKATKRWVTEARKIRYSTREKYNPDSFRWHYKDWHECFAEALKSPRMKVFVKEWGIDRTDWKAMKPYKEEYGS
jgi:hypothetical protein